jgi:hypothetical protein
MTLLPRTSLNPARSVAHDRPRPPEPLPQPISARLTSAAIATGKTFAFPLVLTILVALFLLIQHLLDPWDPRLARSPLNSRDEFVEFE